MKAMKAVLIAWTTVTVLMAGFAVAQEGTPRMIGQGAHVCSSWTALRVRRQSHGAEEWVLGFLSGVAYVGSPKLNPLLGEDAGSVIAWIDSYCRDHPRNRLATAAMGFVNEHPH
jgi:hypothetical protein